MAELEGKRPLSRWFLSAHNLPSSGYFHKIFGIHLQTGSVYLCTKKCLLALLYIWNYNPSPNDKSFPWLALKHSLQPPPSQTPNLNTTERWMEKGIEDSSL